MDRNRWVPQSATLFVCGIANTGSETGVMIVFIYKGKQLLVRVVGFMLRQHVGPT